MLQINERTPNRVTSENLRAIATEGVERALAARKMAGLGLSLEEVKQVGGGLTLRDWIVIGGYLFGQIKGTNHD